MPPTMACLGGGEEVNGGVGVLINSESPHLEILLFLSVLPPLSLDQLYSQEGYVNEVFFHQDTKCIPSVTGYLYRPTEF